MDDAAIDRWDCYLPICVAVATSRSAQFLFATVVHIRTRPPPPFFIQLLTDLAAEDVEWMMIKIVWPINKSYVISQIRIIQA